MISDLEERKLINLPPELITALGRVPAHYGQIEHLLTMTIRRTANLSYDDAVAKVEELRYREKVSKKAKQSFRDWEIRKLGEVEGNDRADKFDDLIKNWADLADRRDDVIHCCWSVGIGDNKLTGTRKGALLEKNGRPLEVTHVKELGNDLMQFVVLLNQATKASQPAGDTKYGDTKYTVAMPGKILSGLRYAGGHGNDRDGRSDLQGHCLLAHV